MSRYALLGKTLAHSQSKYLHKFIADYEYEHIEVSDTAELEKVLKNTEYDGFNVTNPYKDTVIPYLDEVSEYARLANAVNCIKREADGRLVGYNTDVTGFSRMVNNRVKNRKCLILGTGGAARACAVALEQLGARVVILFSRNPEKARTQLGKEFYVTSYDSLYKCYDAEVIVNATPVGTLPNIDKTPIDEVAGTTFKFFESLELAVDLTYNPYRTKFLQDAHRLTGCKTIAGLDMLIFQAIESCNIWKGVTNEELYEKLDTGSIKSAILKNQLNIVAIGMPGSGKSSIFRRYAYEMGLDFVDIDQETEKLMGDTIENVLARGDTGEGYFRTMEHQAILEACKKTHTVIATGGGSILNPINRDLLRANGLVIYVKRPLENLPVNNRPISQNVGVEELFNEREKIYRRVSDMYVTNNKTFGGKLAETGEGDSYNYELKKFVFSLDRKIGRRINEISSNKWT